MPNFIDITGNVYGKLTVISRAHNHGKHIQWFCDCECGTRNYVVIGTSLKNGSTKSCGCLQKEVPLKHGKHDTRLYRIFAGMKTRCYNKKEKKYKDYGGNGIKICSEWLGEDGFINFYNWSLQNGYSDNLTIDRINSQGNYTPENCRWVTYKVQNNNRKNNRYITYNGEKKTITEWGKIYNLSAQTINNRSKKGLSMEEVFKPV